MADGGEGTIEAMMMAAGGTLHAVAVTGPAGESVNARYAVLPDGMTAVIEMAAASGLTLVPVDRRDPLRATSFGTGELIRAAILRGCRALIIGIGGSATNDGGMGMAQALGARFLDAQGVELGRGGKELEKINLIDFAALDRLILGVDVTVACDVTTPLCGPRGATHVFGPQKGATPDMIRRLDAGMENLALILKRVRGIDVRDIPGAGAAGGMGAGLMGFLHARLLPGFSVVSQATGLERRVAGMDLVMTGEGRTDAQTVLGKVPLGVARIAKAHGVPVLCLSGSRGEGTEELHEQGISALLSIVDAPMPLEKAMTEAYSLLTRAAEQSMRLFMAGRGAPTPT
jgi:glycerate 2-kinase